jgi:microsomal dipeptidase-like Zn-dependent dipeptidase
MAGERRKALPRIAKTSTLAEAQHLASRLIGRRPYLPHDAARPPYLIDACQYCNWSERIFRELREGGVDAIQVTVCYHEDFRETVENLIDWNGRFARYAHLILPARTGADIDAARATRRTAVFLGLQNASAIEDDIGLLEILHGLGIRVMQLTYNNQSLLGAGCYEAHDAGITRMGREVIVEMNRLGMLIDMSHSAERTTLEAIELSARPIAITHACPAAWHQVARNKSDTVLKALAGRGGMLGLSLYPLHLKGGSACTLEGFTEMVARLAELIGPEHIGIGSDLCQDQPDSVVEWMRNGRWTRGSADLGTGKAVFPKQPDWFRDNRDFGKLRAGLARSGFADAEIDGIMGGNWHDLFSRSFAANQVP